ncbi:FAD-dependent oxidoreductase [Saxibacter everestensis]|uniref:FAD-dependent oxidoreductase n=1 Tax=Saxibacter everestensis TaxID=2909229 RepID=A0ABY8QR52_9MICO|nr:FAD-dependent oxidoreductase [Brevibacteriaceae bacterium ZFBP1038]
MRNGFGSFWLDSTVDKGTPRPRLEDDVHADYVIVGAGYTGLWTAYWLARESPGARIVILEQDRVGYGASGRNGGWITGKTVGLRKNLVKSARGREAVLEMEKYCHKAVFEIADLFETNGIDIGAARSGWMQIARTESELARLRHHVEDDYSWGLVDDDIRLLGGKETRDRINVPGAVGAIYSPYSVRMNPAKLAYGLAKLCTDLGVTIYENSRVESLHDGTATTSRGSASGEMVVLATEGYTSQLPGMKRDLLPMISSMVVTAPLSDEEWSKIGWENSECMSGAQHMYFYSQRTADGRIALGGRGMPYRFGSRLDENGRLDRRTQRQLTSTLRGLFPQVALEFEHSWCGVLGVTRDWSPFLDVQRVQKLTRVGGYAGQGVTSAYVAGRSVTDLLLDRDTELTRSSWVRPLPGKWEPEPVRWIGSNAMYGMYRVADRIERRRGGPETSIVGTVANKLAGR